MFLPFFNFKGLKCFQFFSSLTNSKTGFCLWGPHLIFSVRSHQPKEGTASEANSHVHVPQIGPCILEPRLQPLLRGSQRLSIAALISPAQRKALSSDAWRENVTHDQALGSSVLLQRSQTLQITQPRATKLLQSYCLGFYPGISKHSDGPWASIGSLSPPRTTGPAWPMMFYPLLELPILGVSLTQPISLRNVSRGTRK